MLLTRHARVNIILTSHELCMIILIQTSATVHCEREGTCSESKQETNPEMVNPLLLFKLFRVQKCENILCCLTMEELLSPFRAYCVSDMKVQNKLSIQHKSKC